MSTKALQRLRMQVQNDLGIGKSKEFFISSCPSPSVAQTSGMPPEANFSIHQQGGAVQRRGDTLSRGKASRGHFGT